MTKSRILETVHEGARDLFRSGVIDARRMREYDALCLPSPPPLSAADIRRLRAQTRMSQAVFAQLLNTSASTVRHWESGTRTPSGPSLKLLHILEHKGMDALL